MFDLSKSIAWALISNWKVYGVFSPSECQARRPIIPFCLRRAAQTVGENNYMFKFSKSVARALIGNCKVEQYFLPQNVWRAAQSFLTV